MIATAMTNKRQYKMIATAMTFIFFLSRPALDKNIFSSALTNSKLGTIICAICNAKKQFPDSLNIAKWRQMASPGYARESTNWLLYSDF